MSILTDASMVGKTVKALNGDRCKIVKALKDNYKLDNGNLIRAKQVMQKGRGFVQTDLTMRDLEDSGAGYVTLKDSGTSKTPAKKPANKPASSGTKQSKNSAKSKEEKTETRRKRKPKQESKEEKASTPRRTQSSKTKTPAKTPDKTPAKTKSKIERVALEGNSKSTLEKLRKFIDITVNEHLVTYHSNINAVTTGVLVNKDYDQIEFQVRVALDVPKPEHHNNEYYFAIAKEIGANLKTPSSKIQAMLATRLDIDEADLEEEFVLSVGDILLDEEGNHLIFCGMTKRSGKNQIVLVDVKNEQALEVDLKFFDTLDWTSSTLTEMFGPSIEDVDVADDDLTDDFDIEDELVPIAELDWENTDRETLIDLLSLSYSDEDIIEFLENNDDIEVTKEDLEAPINELIENLVSIMKDEEIDFEEDDDLEAALEEGDDLEDDELEDDELEDDLDEELEDEDEDLEDDLDDDLEDGEEVEAEELDVDDMLEELLASNAITAAQSRKMSDEKIVSKYYEVFGEDEDEDELEEEAEELTVDEMADALLDADVISAKELRKMSDEDIAEAYAENFDAELDAELDAEEEIEDEDEDELLDDEELLDEDDLEDDLED
tara:strand:- start:2006 stop:3823 length:1818 start_codon:yes stop_codon:yes gene_type:complete